MNADVTVRIITDQRGSHVEPPFNDNWAPTVKFRWLAAVAAAKTGLRIEVWQSDTEDFGLFVGCTSVAFGNVSAAAKYLSGVETGAREALRASAAVRRSDSSAAHQAGEPT